MTTAMSSKRADVDLVQTEPDCEASWATRTGAACRAPVLMMANTSVEMWVCASHRTALSKLEGLRVLDEQPTYTPTPVEVADQEYWRTRTDRLIDQLGRPDARRWVDSTLDQAATSDRADRDLATAVSHAIGATR